MHLFLCLKTRKNNGVKIILKKRYKKFVYNIYLFVSLPKIKTTTKTNDMKTLILKRKWNGYYINQVGDITIVVSQADLSKQWSGTVTNEKEVEDDKYLLYVCYGGTKKEVVSQMISYFTNPK